MAFSIPFSFYPRRLFLLLVFTLLPGLPLAQSAGNPIKEPQDRKMAAVFMEEGRITLDGELQEAEWNLAEAVTDFIQRLPFTGRPATERTEVRILYDRNHIYVGVHCFDSLGEKGITIKDIRPDFYTLDSDGFQVVFDTFDDDRNCFLFGTNPAGGRFDMQIGSDGSASNTAWNGIWYVKTHIDSQGWHAEMSIPLKTLRFQKTLEQQWGVNFERRVRRKSEDSYWGPLPAAFRLGRVSLGGTLQGLHDLKQGQNLYLKPYVSLPFSRRPGGGIRLQPEGGLDLKYALGSQLTLDLTVNTDFSQVEADEEQINLTRYSLFFPEKRDFFLEGASLFKVGRTKAFASRSTRPDVMPFFTRRIGITDDGRLIPILGGARLTGRTGKYTLGLLSMETDSIEQVERANYTMVRVRRDILRKSDVGAFFTNKLSADGQGNRLYGTDMNFNFFKYLEISSFVFKTDSPGEHGNDMSTYAEVGWKDDRFDENYFSLVSDRSHLFMGSLRIGSGGFYGGRRQSFLFSGDLQPGYRFRAGLSWGYNQVRLPGGDFTTHLLGARMGFAFNTSFLFNHPRSRLCLPEEIY